MNVSLLLCSSKFSFFGKLFFSSDPPPMGSMMPEYPQAYLSEIHPAHDDFQVIVKIDRSFSNEVINYVGPSRHAMKEVISLDFVVFDEAGTRMLAKLRSEESRARFMWMLNPGAVYAVICPAVEIGGEGIHEHYHLELYSNTYLRDAIGQFPPLPYNLKTVSQVPWSYKPDEGFFDVVGFVKFCAPITEDNSTGYCEKQFALILQTCKQGCGWAKDEVRCWLRGAWVEAVYKLVREAMNGTDPVFVHVRYVVSSQPLGLPTVSSYSDATSLDIDPPIPEVQRLKQKLLDI